MHSNLDCVHAERVDLYSELPSCQVTPVKMANVASQPADRPTNYPATMQTPKKATLDKCLLHIDLCAVRIHREQDDK